LSALLPFITHSLAKMGTLFVLFSSCEPSLMTVHIGIEKTAPQKWYDPEILE
jgi:hypothetical protein